MTEAADTISFLAIVGMVAVTMGVGYLWLRGLPRLIWAVVFAPLIGWSVTIVIFLISGTVASMLTGGLVSASMLAALWITVVTSPLIADLVAWVTDRRQRADNPLSTPLRGYIIDRRMSANDAAYVLPGDARPTSNRKSPARV